MLYRTKLHMWLERQLWFYKNPLFELKIKQNFFEKYLKLILELFERIYDKKIFELLPMIYK